MAGIYMTYRDISQFAPIAIFSLILSFSQLASAFIFSAASFLVQDGWLNRSIRAFGKDPETTLQLIASDGEMGALA